MTDHKNKDTAAADAANRDRTPATSDQAEADAITPNPPRTVSAGGKFAAPKFGSAGGGGAELEPGPERD